MVVRESTGQGPSWTDLITPRSGDNVVTDALFWYLSGRPVRAYRGATPAVDPPRRLNQPPGPLLAGKPAPDPRAPRRAHPE